MQKVAAMFLINVLIIVRGASDAMYASPRVSSKLKFNPIDLSIIGQQQKDIVMMNERRENHSRTKILIL